LVTNEGLLESAAKLYADGKDLKDPLVSPVYGDFTGFPPDFLVSGTRDLFLSNAVGRHMKMRRARVVADLMVIEGVSRAEYLFLYESPESKLVYSQLKGFLLKYLE